MPINSDLSDLPSAARQEGNPPRQPRVVTKLADQWLVEWQARENFEWGHVIPDAGPYRGSYASKRCDRQLEYAFRGTEPTEPPDVAGVYRMALGTMVHDAFQAVMDKAFGLGWESEKAIDLNVIGIPGSMRVDGVQSIVYSPDTEGVEKVDVQIPIELKTINGFGFKIAATTFKGAPSGPRSGHELQLAFAICALDAPYGVLGYLSLEAISPSLVKSLYRDPTPVQEFAAEWAVSRDEAEALVDYEAKRISRLLDFIEAHPDDRAPRELHDAEYPVGAQVLDPNRGTWVTMSAAGRPTQTGRTWMCDYCDHRTQCIEDGAGYVAPDSTEF